MTRWTAAGLFVPAGLLIGMGIGFVTDRLVAGLLIGLGGGFLALALAALWSSRGAHRSARHGPLTE